MTEKVKDAFLTPIFSLGNVLTILSAVVGVIIYTQATFATIAEVSSFKNDIERQLSGIQSDVKYIIRQHVETASNAHPKSN